MIDSLNIGLQYHAVRMSWTGVVTAAINSEMKFRTNYEPRRHSVEMCTSVKGV